MGLSTLPSLTRQLDAAGLSLGTPAVAVERGTTAQQRSVYAPLGQLQEEVRGHAVLCCAVLCRMHGGRPCVPASGQWAV